MRSFYKTTLFPLFAFLAFALTPFLAIAETAPKEPAVSEQQKDFTIYDETITKDPAKRAEFIVKMFNNGCFRYYFERDEFIAWANQYLTEVPQSEAANYLGSVSAKEGRVWHANISGGKRPLRNDTVSGGEVVLILEKGGKCHTLGYGTDEKSLHDHLAAFAKEITQSMVDNKISYKYLPISADRSYNRSEILIRLPGEKAVVYVFASSVSGGLNEHTASITIDSNLKMSE